jgi:soluble lytic murein transglycosylase-like protein
MTFNLLRTLCPTILQSLLCGFLLSVTIQAQTSAGTTALDDWRTNFDRRLDGDLEQLNSSQGFATNRAVSAVPSVHNALQLRSNALPEFGYRSAGRSLAMVKSILQSRGLPASLIGVVAVESGFNPVALSNKGAAGLWQLMPGTARQYGLVVSADQDDRFDEYKSTIAATSYLQQLHDQFGDWPLALAAYNAGSNRVLRGLGRFHAQNFWTLQRNSALPEETLAYVPKVLAAMGSRLVSQHPPYTNHEGKIIFAVTSPQVFTLQDVK